MTEPAELRAPDREWTVQVRGQGGYPEIEYKVVASTPAAALRIAADLEVGRD